MAGYWPRSFYSVMERGGMNTFSLDTAGNPKQARWPYYNDSYVVKSTAIRQEIRDIEQGIMDRTNNPLKVNLWNDYYIEFSVNYLYISILSFNEPVTGLSIPSSGYS